MSSPKHLFFAALFSLRPRAPAHLPSRTLGPERGRQRRHPAQDCPPGRERHPRAGRCAPTVPNPTVPEDSSQSAAGAQLRPPSLPRGWVFQRASPGGPQLTAAPALSGYLSSFCQSSAPRWPARRMPGCQRCPKAAAATPDHLDPRATNVTQRLHGTWLEPSLSVFLLILPQKHCQKAAPTPLTFRSWMVKGSS